MPQSPSKVRRPRVRTPLAESPLPVPDAKDARRLSQPLLDWYAEHHRDLPWRRHPEPYAIWVSEMMLQQTQVVTVLPYFERWMRAFPTLHSLAQAEEAQVLALWQGLGYYSRARSLQRGARYVVESLNGAIPEQPADLAKLPGIGPYTAGAIASIAFQRDAPLVDGNVSRVLARWFALKGNLQQAPLKTHLWTLAEALLPKGQAREFNQALMELGALVCTPQKPRCAECPVRTRCRAFAENVVTEIPTPALRAKVTAVQKVAVVTERAGKWLLGQLPSDAPRWANFWQFPNCELQAGESAEAAVPRCIRDWSSLEGQAGRRVYSLKHSVTRYRIELTAVQCSLGKGAVRANCVQALRWVTAEEAEALALPAADRKLMRWLARSADSSADT